MKVINEELHVINRHLTLRVVLVIVRSVFCPCVGSSSCFFLKKKQKYKNEKRKKVGGRKSK